MRRPNKAIQRVRYPIPTVNEISIELNGAKFFSKLDLTQTYHRLSLHDDSRYITIFNTHVGLYRYTRLNYGLIPQWRFFNMFYSKTCKELKEY